MKHQNDLKKVFLFITALIACCFISCSSDGGSSGNVESSKTYYTVSFDSDGGSFVPAQSVESGKRAVEPKSPTKDGYTFKGWYNGASEFNFSKIISSDITLKAKWVLNSCKVLVETNGGIPEPYEIYVEYGEIIAEPDCPAKNGYRFDGWYADGDFLERYDFSNPIYENIVIYARWDPWEYSIYYDLDGGINSDLNPISYTIETPTITLEKPTKDNYKFVGWRCYGSEGDMGFVTEIPQGTFGQISLYANWTLDFYTVTFDANGGNEISEVCVINGESFSEPEHPEKAGYTFSGWYTDSNLTDSYDFSNSVIQDLTLYAKWIPTEYSIYYELEGGRNSFMNPNSYTIETPTFILESPTKTGYTFTGWVIYWNNSDYGGVVTDFAQGNTGDITLVAKWDIDAYRVSFDTNGGGSISDAYVDYGYAVSEPSAPEKTGYSFAGWYEDSNLLTQYSFSHAVTQNITLYAKWTPIEYEIHYELNGGTNSSNNPSSYTIENPEITLAAPTKSGYSFAGWVSNSSYISNIQQGTVGDLYITAQWIENTAGITVTLENKYSDYWDLSLDVYEYTVTTTGGFEAYRWFLDGIEQNSSNDNRYVVSPEDLESGYHSVMVVVTDANGSIRSAKGTLTIQK